MNTSVWSSTFKLPEFETLATDIKCDVLVIGGGMAGILIANELKQNGYDVIVAEGQRIGSGVTKNTTAVVSAQHDTLYLDLVNKHGITGAKQYLTANLWAVDKIRELADDCDFEALPSIMFTRNNADIQTLKEEIECLKELGFSADFVTESSLPFKIAGGVRFNNMGQFHPLKFLAKMTEGLKIYENTFITKIKKNTAYTEHNQIEAKYIVIATHYPFERLTGLYFMKQFQNRSYVIGIKSGKPLGATFSSYDDDGLYFRSYNDTLLIGGGDRRVGSEGCCYDQMRKAAEEYFPDSTEEFAFAAQDCITLDGVPYIGGYGLSKNHYIATGFNEWGMTTSMISAKIISDMIMKKQNSFADVFSPYRSILRKQLFKNLGTVVVSLIKPTPKRCPHMGSSLIYNKVENTWECPCHGSRFNEDGKIIDNPAMKDVEM